MKYHAVSCRYFIVNNHSPPSLLGILRLFSRLRRKLNRTIYSVTVQSDYELSSRTHVRDLRFLAAPSLELTLSKAEGLRTWLEMTRKRIFAMTRRTVVVL
ncbi:MAG: hypothetical protein XU11_C0011G0052 [Candidatus Dadabacteria bacterium CSP1-2]|nr:MAG: hypothetical protein XU11_C0011G0052 [Candidatus Dadabacteria bacterium CSP1-2]